MSSGHVGRRDRQKPIQVFDHFKWFDVCPDATYKLCPSSQYPVLKVHAPRPIRFDRAARQGDILPDGRGAGGVKSLLHISFTKEFSTCRFRQVRQMRNASSIWPMTGCFIDSYASAIFRDALYPNTGRLMFPVGKWSAWNGEPSI